MFTKNFTYLNKNDANIAGGKGASLGEMIQSGIPVPPGFVVLAGTFEKFLEETDLGVEVDAILETVDHNAMHTVEHASEKIQALIKKAQMPESIAREIEKEFVKLDAEFVAVRSSATAEDGAENAWAGQLDSYLNTTRDNLLEKVQHCWASLFTPRAIFYRFEKGLHTQKISVAVVVQKMVASEISGIAFSVHPVTEDYNQLIIEAGFGLGEAIVSGSITPDSYVVEKEPRNILDINVATQIRGLYRAQNGGNQWQDIAEPQASSQVLTSEQILELSEIILGIENHYGFPCDIEWAFEAGKFYIVQSRPITTLAKKASVLDENWQKIWTTEYSLFSVWLFGWDFTNACLKETGVGFSDAIFSINGDLATLFRLDDEQRAFSRHFAKRMIVENGFKEKVRKSIIDGQIELEKFEKMNYEDFLTMENLKRFISVHNKFVPYYLGNLWAPNELATLDFDEDSKNEILKLCQTLRKKTETILPNLEKFLQNIFNFISQREKIDNKLLRSIIPGELVEYAHSGNLPEIPILKDRYKNAALWAKGATIEIFTGEKAMNLIDRIYKVQIDLKEIRGDVAQKGFCKGFAKIIFSKKDTMKIKKGDVIVTTMTRPEWVPAMKIAGAFVTDAGSVLCHAAIVARELNKPCIISTKIATQVLHDGDLVEVDANNGVVRILERNNGDSNNIQNFIASKTFHKQFVYSFLPTVSKTFLPIFTFEATTNCYLNNPLVDRLGLKKLPNFVITLKDGYDDWEDGDMQRITKNSDIEFIVQECRTIMEKYSQFTEKLLQKDYSKIDNIELAEILRKSNEVMQEVCQRQIFLIRDFIETKNPEYIKILPELRVEITNFVDKFYISCNDILTSLADRFGQIPWRTFMYATTGEIIELLQDLKTPEEFAKINNRQAVFIFDGEKISFITDTSIIAKIDEALKKQEVENKNIIDSKQYETIHGNTAFGGHAKGNVVKITDAQYRDIAKYLKGKKDYILAISMTRPEFMPYLKNCKAIITDEGGITCHAAIVSRELKIPCIIGTKIATQVLHDGDLVEVDADKGIVKIIQNTPQEYRQIFNRTIDMSGCELWDLGERLELPKICEDAIYFDPLFYYQSGKGVSVFYNFSDPKQQLTPLVQYFNQHKEKLFELKKPFDTDCQEVRKILKNKDSEDAAKLFDLIVKTWPLIVSSNILGDDSRENVFGVDDDLVDEYINIRKESDGVSHLGEVLLVNFIKNLVPSEYKEWAELLKYSEVVSGNLPEISELQKRKKCYVYHKGKIYSGLTLDEYAKQNNLHIVTHKDRVDLSEIKNEITGQSAYKGVQQGIVKVVFEKKDIAKVEKGDIMVTPMTTPDLIAAMQMASAFVTDEGGITCHAAIVAREMAKPCIIGTKIATEILKDGDLVEVDAHEGIIRILKN